MIIFDKNDNEIKKMKFYPHQNDHLSHLLYNQISWKNKEQTGTRENQ